MQNVFHEWTCKPGSVNDDLVTKRRPFICARRLLVASGRDLPGCGQDEQPCAGPKPDVTLFGLAPDGVYPADRVTPAAGALLPHRFTLTTHDDPQGSTPFGGLLSVALALISRSVDVIDHPALWCPDFPPVNLRNRKNASGRPVHSRKTTVNMTTVAVDGKTPRETIGVLADDGSPAILGRWK